MRRRSLATRKVLCILAVVLAAVYVGDLVLHPFYLLGLSEEAFLRDHISEPQTEL